MALYNGYMKPLTTSTLPYQPSYGKGGFTTLNDPRPSGVNPLQPVVMSGPAPNVNRTGNPFLNGSNYGGGKNLYDSPFVRDFLSPEVPRGEFERVLTQAGGGGNDRRGQFMRSLYDRTQSGYQAAVLTNPELSYRDYINKYVGAQNLSNQWLAQTAAQRGLNPASRTTMIRF